jgi:hypothetical protein
MEFIHLTENNARKYIGKQIIFKLKEKPYIYKLCNIIGNHLVIETEEKENFLLSIKHPTFVIVYNNFSVNSFHYSMIFLKAFPNNITSYIGNYVLIKNNNKLCSIQKIKTVSKSKYYISLNDVMNKDNIDIRNTPCYVIV